MVTIVRNYENTGGNWNHVSFDLKRIRRLILVPRYGSTGSENTIATEAGVTAAALQALCINSNKYNRYYPLPNMKNVTFREGESKFFTWDDDEKVHTREGAAGFEGYIELVDGGPALTKRLMSGWNSAEFGVFVIDEDKNFWYNLDSAGTILKPIPVAGGSFVAKYIPPTGADDIGKVKIVFDWSTLMDWGQLRYISYASGDLDFDGTDYGDIYPLWDVTITKTGEPSTTAWTLDIVTDYGIPVTGLAKTDMYLYNTTDSAQVTISTSTESTTVPGRYALAYSAETAGDGLRFNLLAASKYDPADTETGTIPT